MASRPTDCLARLVCRQLTACHMTGHVTRHMTRQVARHLTTAATFKCADLEIELCRERREKPEWDKLTFGHTFSDHMLLVKWRQDTGWGKPRITPLQNLSLHPAAKVFHYAPEARFACFIAVYAGKLEIYPKEMIGMTDVLFEGLKAYRGVDGKIRLFRPMDNVNRMLMTAKRVALPVFDGEEMLKCLKALVRVDRDWVPQSDTSTLYIRPTMIGTEATLGVSVSTECLLFVLTGPVGPYYPTGFQPVALLADPKYVRAFEGGCGMYKMGANYAPTVLVQEDAVSTHGCQQVLWLYGPDHQLTEVGTMNVFMFWINEHGEKELITPPLDQGIILPGVTRRSLLALAREWGEFKVSEKPFTMQQVIRGLKEGRVKELFGAGTACVVSPVNKIVYEGSTLEIPTMDDGAPLVTRFYDILHKIQYGAVQSDWTIDIDDD